MTDDLRPEDRTLGTALSRAVEAQPVRETRFADSRLGVNMNKRRRGSVLLPAFATVAAVVVGVFIGTALLNRGAAPSQVATSPSPSAPAAVPSLPAPSGTPGALGIGLIYFGRDGLPPVGVEVSVEVGIPVDQRIGRLLSALGSKTRVAIPPGAVDLFPQSNSGVYQGQRVTVSGDQATVDFNIQTANGDWGVRGAAATTALLQQIVYTATEAPGIRRVLITQNGGERPRIDQLVVDRPLTREDVNGYSATIDERIVAENEALPASATATVSNDVVAPALGRLAVELQGSPAPSSGFWSPRFTAELRRNDDPGVQGKWILQIGIPGATDNRSRSHLDVRGGPIVEVRTGQQQAGVTYSIGLSDARPWRVSVERGSSAGTMRLLVDIGGHPSALANGTAVYVPEHGASISRSRPECNLNGCVFLLEVSGVARAFEATVSWRVRDSGGREVAKGFTNASVGTSAVWGTFRFVAQVPSSVSGNITVDVYQASPRDGSDTNKVELRLQVR